MTAFDHLSWGDPMLAQIGGSDAQAYANDPLQVVIGNMSTGFEQAPSDVLAVVSGANQPAQVAASTKDDCVCANVRDWELWKPCYWTCVNPGSKQGSEQIKKVTGIDTNGIVMLAVIGLLAVGLILLGAKNVMEA